MTENLLDDLKQKILFFFRKYPNEQFKPTVIARRLSIKNQEETRLLRQALNQLHQAKAIDRGRGKRYGHAAPPPSSRETGILSITKQGNGIVKILGPETKRISIPAKFLGTALNGDTVSVALFAQPEETTDGEHAMPEGEIVAIIERSEQPFVGIFKKANTSFLSSRIIATFHRDVYIPQGKTKGARPGQKVVALLDSWESRNLNPEGHIIEILGQSGDIGTEMTAVAREFQLPLHFPNNVLAEANNITDTISTEEIAQRLDLRELNCFTIDPEDAKDFDDAVSLEPLSDGGFRLGVHIADVSHFVQEGSELDDEAEKRGTSVYLANEVIPMLPENLSNNICSLRPGVDRLTYSAFMTLTQSWYGKRL